MPTIPRYTAAVLRLYPRGLADLSEGTLIRADLENLAAAIDTSDDQISELVIEMDPLHADALLSRWEELYQLKAGTLSEAERRGRLIARIRLLRSFRPVDIEARIEDYTSGTWSLTETGPFRCDDPGSLCDDPNDVVDGAFVFFLDITHAEAVSCALRRDDVQALISRIKPAHTIGLVRVTDGFFTNDPYSLVERDLL